MQTDSLLVSKLRTRGGGRLKPLCGCRLSSCQSPLHSRALSQPCHKCSTTPAELIGCQHHTRHNASLKALHTFRQVGHSPEVLQGKSMHQAHEVGQVLDKPSGCLACVWVSVQILRQVASIHVHGLHHDVKGRLSGMC